MADFILKKPTAFSFALEEDEKTVYTLPPLKGFSFEEGRRMADIDDEEDNIKKGEMIRAFILEKIPALADKDISDMQYIEIFNAYASFEGRKELGESKASQNSSKNTARQ